MKETWSKITIFKHVQSWSICEPPPSRTTLFYVEFSTLASIRYLWSPTRTACNLYWNSSTNTKPDFLTNSVPTRKQEVFFYAQMLNYRWRVQEICLPAKSKIIGHTFQGLDVCSVYARSFAEMLERSLRLPSKLAYYFVASYWKCLIY